MQLLEGQDMKVEEDVKEYLTLQEVIAPVMGTEAESNDLKSFKEMVGCYRYFL